MEGAGSLSYRRVVAGGVIACALALASGCKKGPPPDPGPAPSLAWETDAAGRSLPLDLVAVDGERFHLDDRIRLQVETWDPDADAAVPLTSDGLAVIIDGVWRPGTFTIEGSGERTEPLALALVVALDAHADDATHAALDQGLGELGRRLGAHDVALAWRDGADGLVPYMKRGPAVALATLITASAPRGASRGPESAVADALAKIAESEPTLPARRHMLLVGDGHRTAPTANDRKLLQYAVELAYTLATRIDVIGLEADPPALETLEEIAAKTRGHMRRLPIAAAGKTLKATLDSYGRELASRWFITFTPADYAGSERPTMFELAVRSPDGRFARDVLESVKVVPKPLD